MDKLVAHSLIERLEKLQGPDREVGNEILRASGWTIKTNQSSGTGSRTSVWWRDPTGEYFSDGCQPDLTKSIDAALTLIEKKSSWALECAMNETAATIYPNWDIDPLNKFSAFAPTPAIAICIASLRARAALEDKERG